jgi:ketosteroid isomerase-like protein
MRALLTFALAFAASFSAFGQRAKQAMGKDHTAEQKVLAVIHKLADAGIRRDVKTIARLYSDDYFHTNADGSIMTKAQVLASYRARPDVTAESNEHGQEKVQLDGDIAVVSSRVTYKGLFKDQPFSRLYRVTYVLKQRRGRWQVIASHASLMGQ